MPRYIIKEGILDKFFGGIFSAIGKGYARRVMKILQFDPELQKLAQDVDDAYDDMYKYVTDREKRDPEYAALIKKHYRPIS
jgi:dTDP-D-glucose 4,6-dehydratase